MKNVQPDIEEKIENLYEGFNRRTIDPVLALMHPEVHWPKAFEGGYVVGTEAIRDYWKRQWTEINPVVMPVAVTERPDGKIEVLVDQKVKDLDGKSLFDGHVKHVYTVQDGLFKQMDVE
jgi:ketosteroid isomerase-like protein